jgi:hypothetical protein
MKTSKWFMMVIAALALLSFAGGWATVTLDALPENVVAGQPLTIGFVVRQHGVTPLGNLSPAPTVYATNPATGERVTAKAKDEGAVGHYVATITLPSAGTWNWEVHAFGPVAKLAPLTVVSAATTASPIAPSAVALSSGRVALAGMIVVIGLAAGLLGLRASRGS